MEAAIHTHDCYVYMNNDDYAKFNVLNDEFSTHDHIWSNNKKIKFYLVSPNGRLQLFDPHKMIQLPEKIVGEWKLPHDKNHPDLPPNHKKDCEDCFERRESNDE